jgi:hypothetical protein
VPIQKGHANQLQFIVFGSMVSRTLSSQVARNSRPIGPNHTSNETVANAQIKRGHSDNRGGLQQAETGANNQDSQHVHFYL